MRFITPEGTDAKQHHVTLAELRIHERRFSGEVFAAHQRSGKEQIVLAKDELSKIVEDARASGANPDPGEYRSMVDQYIEDRIGRATERLTAAEKSVVSSESKEVAVTEPAERAGTVLVIGILALVAIGLWSALSD